jgi:hypothetical protein
MAKTKQVVLIVLLLLFGVVMGRCANPPKGPSTPVMKEIHDITQNLYLKEGSIIACDMVWEGLASQILCRRSDTIVAYSAGEVDLTGTFGVRRAKKIAARYKEGLKQRERMSTPTIGVSKQERTEQEQLATAKEYRESTAPVTPSVIESKVDGQFEGWEGNTVVRLINGELWQQTDGHISIAVKIMPDVLIYRSDGQWKMKVEGIPKDVAVERLR